MKKLKLIGKLTLNKETVSKLNDDQMVTFKGGVARITINSYLCPPTIDKGCVYSLWNQDTCQGFCTYTD